jgi:hypothetical protein
MIDGNSMHSGVKTADGAIAPVGTMTVGGAGYISANMFQVSSSGEAFFSGSISISDADIGGKDIEDTFEIVSGNFQLKDGAYIDGLTIQSIFDTIDTDTGCFIAGTQILMSDDTYKNIEDVKVNDFVKSFDVGVSSVVNSKVTETFVHHNRYYMILNGTIKTTSVHPFYSDGNWIEAGDLSIGDKILYIDGLEHTIETIEFSDKLTTVYNFEVDGTHNYFAEGYLVHNKLPNPDFTQGHNYFVTSSLTLEAGDAVKLNNNNLLEKTTSAKSTDCVGIVWGLVSTYVSKSYNEKTFLPFNHSEDLSKQTRLNNALSSSMYVDSFGSVKQNDSNFNLYKVGSLGDTREINEYYDKSSNTVSVDSGSCMMGFKICNQGGLVSKGDLLCTSDTNGYLMKQPSEYVITSFSGSNPVYEERQNINSFTVGKAMESCSFDSNGKVEGVYGYLYCG